MTLKEQKLRRLIRKKIKQTLNESFFQKSSIPLLELSDELVRIGKQNGIGAVFSIFTWVLDELDQNIKYKFQQFRSEIHNEIPK